MILREDFENLSTVNDIQTRTLNVGSVQKTDEWTLFEYPATTAELSSSYYVSPITSLKNCRLWNNRKVDLDVGIYVSWEHYFDAVVQYNSSVILLSDDNDQNHIGLFNPRIGYSRMSIWAKNNGVALGEIYYTTATEVQSGVFLSVEGYVWRASDGYRAVGYLNSKMVYNVKIPFSLVSDIGRSAKMMISTGRKDGYVDNLILMPIHSELKSYYDSLTVEVIS